MKKRKPRLIDLDWSKEVGNTAIGRDRGMRGKQGEVKGRAVCSGTGSTCGAWCTSHEKQSAGLSADSGLSGRKPSRLRQGLRSHEHEDGG